MSRICRSGPPDFDTVEVEGYHEAMLEFRERERREIDSRPPCPDCGATGYDVRSKGINWRCTVCGRFFAKNPRKRSVERPEGLGCPECGGSNIISEGIAWRCKNGDCGRKWLKKRRVRKGKEKENRKELF